MKRTSFIGSLLFLPIAKVLGKANVLPSKACKTQRDAEGPYYKSGAPLKMIIETEGQPLQITGTVFKASDCSTPVANAIIDIWHCDSSGQYDSNGFKCRGFVKTDARGKYSFKTIFPPPYGSRPRHIHVKVRAEGHSELTTQIYFQGDPNLKNDFARNAEATRVISLQGAKEDQHGMFDIYI